MNFLIKNNRFKIIIDLSRRAFWCYKWQIVVLTIIGFISGLLEGIGINAIIPLFSFIIGGERGDDIISKTIMQGFEYLHIDFNLVYILVFICLMFIFKAAAILIFSYVQIKITTDYEERTKNELFSSLVKSNWSHLLKQRLGHLETLIINDVRYAGGTLRQIGNIVMVITSLLMYIAIAVNISLHITLITLILGAILFLIFKPLMYQTRVASSKTAETNKQVGHFISESVLGIKTISSMVVGGTVIKRASEYFYHLKKMRIRLFFLSDFTSSIMQPVSLIFICIVFAFAYKAPNFNFAVLVATMYLIQRMFQHIQQAQATAHTLNENFPYLKSVLDYQEKSLQNKEENKGNAHFTFDRSLEFRDISFAYEKGGNVLEKVNFSIKKGEMVGLIGKSGVGKTTIVDLILRLFNPKTGAILLDSKDASEIDLYEWRNNIGYVSQDIFLMNDTIANNIRFYDKSITESQIEEAAKMANIYDFIQKCPDGFSTFIGERGIMLSAGQRQRIIIARVLAKNPKLLILDEATSALDNESEAKVQKVIENLKGKTTVLAVAHRLSTLRNSDKLIVLDKGEIIEQGSPSELLKDGQSYFYRVYNIRD